MGIGDDIIATGMARGAFARGKRIAFGDGRKIIWGPHSEMIFKGNPNIARPGSESGKDIEWVNYYKGHRIYNTAGARQWYWNYEFKVKPGEIFLSPHEENWPDVPEDLILIEPNTPKKPCAPNKQWPVDRFMQLASLLGKKYTVRQFAYAGATNFIAPGIETKTFRNAIALLKKARLAILPEGGLHHAAAAVDTRAIVLFGGFAPPPVLGYKHHINLVGSDRFCGSFGPCVHCSDAMNNISIDRVMTEVEREMRWH